MDQLEQLKNLMADINGRGQGIKEQMDEFERLQGEIKRVMSADDAVSLRKKMNLERVMNAEYAEKRQRVIESISVLDKKMRELDSGFKELASPGSSVRPRCAAPKAPRNGFV